MEVSSKLIENICTASNDAIIFNDSNSETIFGNIDATNAEYDEETETDMATDRDLNIDSYIYIDSTTW